ncbi:MAG: nucleotide exchange factor GrpE [Candidatus Saccharibacteria bacterium]|nr:nucleotide exchange factor GrpE [Candidatus Saccharibacteria bacterium]
MKKAEEKVQQNYEQQLGELQEKYQRALADFANHQKQSEIQREQARQAGAESTILKILPLIDDMFRAFSANPELAPVEKTLEKTMSDLKIEKINSAPETPFNPDFHDAISMDDSDGDTEVIAEELRPGYLYDGNVIRPAMVKVKKISAPEAPKEETN